MKTSLKKCWGDPVKTKAFWEAYDLWATIKANSKNNVLKVKKEKKSKHPLTKIFK